MGSFEAFAAWGADDREAGFPVHCLHWKTSKQWETTLVLIDFLLRDEIVYNKKTLTVLCEASIVSRHLQFMTIMNSEPVTINNMPDVGVTLSKQSIDGNSRPASIAASYNDEVVLGDAKIGRKICPACLKLRVSH